MKKIMVKLKIPTIPYIPHDLLFDFCCFTFFCDNTSSQVWQIKIKRIFILILMQAMLM